MTLTIPQWRQNSHTILPTVEQIAASQVDITPPVTVTPTESPAELHRIQKLHAAQVYKQNYMEAVAAYNAIRLQMHSTLGAVWDFVQNYENAINGPLPIFEREKFMSIHIPILGVPSTLDGGFTTTQSAAMQYQNSYGKNWG